MSFFRASGIAQGVFQPEGCHGASHPLLRAIRSAPFDGFSDPVQFLPGLRLIEPLPIVGRFGHRPRAEEQVSAITGRTDGQKNRCPWLPPLERPTVRTALTVATGFRIHDSHRSPRQARPALHPELPIPGRSGSRTAPTMRRAACPRLSLVIFTSDFRG